MRALTLEDEGTTKAGVMVKEEAFYGYTTEEGTISVSGTESETETGSGSDDDDWSGGEGEGCRRDYEEEGEDDDDEAGSGLEYEVDVEPLREKLGMAGGGTVSMHSRNGNGNGEDWERSNLLDHQGRSAVTVPLEPFDHQVGGHSHIFRFSKKAVCKVS